MSTITLNRIVDPSVVVAEGHEEEGESLARDIGNWLKAEGLEYNARNHMLIVPAKLLPIIEKMMQHINDDEIFTLIPAHKLFDERGAANFLNVSPSYARKLLAEGDIPSHAINGFLWVRFDDLNSFKERIMKERDAALGRMIAESQAMGEYS